MLHHAVSALLAGGCDAALSVLGADAAKVLEEITADTASWADFGPRLATTVNQEWDTGLASSLRAAAELIPKAAHAVIVLVDQPGLNGELIEQLLRAHLTASGSSTIDQPRITAAGYQQHGSMRRGHPTALARSSAGRV